MGKLIKQRNQDAPPPAGYFFKPEDAGAKAAGGGLAKEFGLPPFSVFDARSGEWQERKSAWIALGIKSEVGRGENLLKFSDTVLQPDPKKRATAIPGGGTGKNSAWKFRTGDGEYKSVKELETSSRAVSRAIGTNRRFNASAMTQKIIDQGRRQTPSLKGGLVVGTTIHPYDGTDPDTTASASGTSIFDPMLCEMFYRWFVPPAGRVLDPFAGGSVRGVVASVLGYQYLGVDLRPEQVEANRQQAEEICTSEPPPWIEGAAERPMPEWFEGDSTGLLDMFNEDGATPFADAVFSCPPYADLERYSDDPRDISTMEWEEFCEAYWRVIWASTQCLKDDRFACFVVTEIRDKKTGMCRGLVPTTTHFFQEAGLKLYNDAVLLNAVGSLSIRVGKQFRASRKLGRTHQNVLIFVKGSPERAIQAIQEAEQA